MVKMREVQAIVGHMVVIWTEEYNFKILGEISTFYSSYWQALSQIPNPQIPNPQIPKPQNLGTGAVPIVKFIKYLDDINHIDTCSAFRPFYSVSVSLLSLRIPAWQCKVSD